MTLSEIKACLRAAGKSHADIARELSVSTAIVQGVLSGRFKGISGEAHKVAVALGLKEGVIVPDGMPISEAMRLAGEGGAPRRTAKPRSATRQPATAREGMLAPVKESAR